MGTRSFRVVNWLGHGVDYPSSPSSEVKERIELYSYFLPGPERERETDRQRESNNEVHEKLNGV
jgi:hypothetical protein